jgi:HPt (histidine-containing phosphotransfer) domain-containing protein
MSTTPNQPDPDESVINWAAALEATGDDQSLLDELVILFLDESSTLLSNIRRAIEEGDMELLRRSSHTLKGSLRIFDSRLAIDYAAQMEQLGKNSQLDQAPALLQKLEPQLKLVIDELKRHNPA